MVLGISTEYQTGATGKEVSQIQAALAFAGYLQTSPDGIYGPKTKEAVQRFQSDKGLAIDGIVGPNTWAALFGGNPAPATPPALIRPPPSSPPTALVPRPGGSAMFAGLDMMSDPMKIIGGLGLLLLASMGLVPKRTKRRKRR